MKAKPCRHAHCVARRKYKTLWQRKYRKLQEQREFEALKRKAMAIR